MRFRAFLGAKGQLSFDEKAAGVLVDGLPDADGLRRVVHPQQRRRAGLPLPLRQRARERARRDDFVLLIELAKYGCVARKNPVAAQRFDAEGQGHVLDVHEMPFLVVKKSRGRAGRYG